MRLPPGPDFRRALRLAGGIVLVGIVCWLSSHTPPDVHPGILHIVPLLLVTWRDGRIWGITFAAGTGARACSAT